MSLKYVINDLITMASSLPTCKNSGFGDLRLYDNKADVEYPYVNIDILSSTVFNGSSKNYKLRVYVMDKNESYIAYNKSELLLNLIMAQYEIPNFIVNYFDLDYKDMVSGVYADFEYNVIINKENGCI